METRLTLRPGMPGTKKLQARFGDKLARVRYVYDKERGRSLKTVEFVVDEVQWQPRDRRPRRRPQDLVGVRVAYDERTLRQVVKAAGGSRAASSSRLAKRERTHLPVDFARQMAFYARGCLPMLVDGNSIAAGDLYS